MKRLAIAIALVATMGPGATRANSSGVTPAASDAVRTLDTMVVGGRRAGPAIWEFTRGNKTVWVLGTVQALPEGFAFDPAEIEARIAQSEVILGSPGLVVGENIGILRGLTLWPSIRRAKFNPSGQSLKDVLPSATYTRWQGVKSRILGGDRGAERLRPMYAAYELFDAAAGRSHLTWSGAVARVIDRSAKKHRVPLIDPSLRLAIKNPRDAVKQFHVARADDILCLRQTLEGLDPFMRSAPALADAWASGDIGQLPELVSGGLNFCWARLTNQAIAAQQGIADLDRQIDAKWLGELRQTLSKHDTVFTTLPVRDLIGSTGLVAALKRDGFLMSPVVVGDPKGSHSPGVGGF